MKRKLLFLSFYYPPDLSAGSFRAVALVNEFAQQSGFKWDIEVLTTMPTRYKSYTSAAKVYENEDSVTVRRFSLPEHQSGMFDQSIAYLSFVRQVVRTVRGQHYDAVFATTSRLASGVLGAWLANHGNVPFYLDIRDIFSETIGDVLHRSFARVLLPLIKTVERYAISSATRVNVVSAGFLPYFEEYGSTSDWRVFSNGIDDAFLVGNFRKSPDNSLPKKLLYAGNIGEGQGLHRIVPEMAQALGEDWCIQIIGDGGRRDNLIAELQTLGITNVTLLNPVPRSELMEYYHLSDVLFLHLNDYQAFNRVLPSKIFEYAATGKPILAGVSGYAAKFIEENIPNSAIFPPCNVSSAIDGVRSLKLEQTSREEFINQFSRKKIVKEMAADMVQTFSHQPRKSVSRS